MRVQNFHESVWEYFSATETKPVTNIENSEDDIPVGQKLLDATTFDIYCWNGSAWVKMGA